jgi:hypothetical protein
MEGRSLVDELAEYFEIDKSQLTNYLQKAGHRDKAKLATLARHSHKLLARPTTTGAAS